MQKIHYADESGFEEHYSRTHGYAPRGERVYGEIPGTHFGRTSPALLLHKSRLWRSAFLPMHVVGAIDQNNDFFAGFAFKGYMNSDLFCGWLEHVYAPALENPKKSILFIDNASHHPKDRIFDIAEEHGFFVIFLPKYSPDYNKIEKYWANIKNWLRLHLHNFDNFGDGLIHAFGVR